MRRNRSYTYELMDGTELLSRVKQALKEEPGYWQAVIECLPAGVVEYKPIRNSPMRAGQTYQYRQAGLNLTLYFPEKQFEGLLDDLVEDKVMELKQVIQNVIPDRSGYIINEFKIKGILDDPKHGAS
ncbi:hypothetical protein NITGR_980037 [Nitrospina gracilis 3/211]|uniref:Uncharacterized protein n=1 Tax=Nitrospina gracilis (strain 3/211) TaxID=1266370 RepID=M1Z2E6_NITG3|nr:MULTISPECIES: hypothetical protein [Nitrospina]MCF8722035.1 hypothetical protein [Nitrospina sp. Nb-3]CCQ92162.1 hypothetical protein NITGR_980037 [Nitrospina gracilis 3/211]